MPCLGDEAPPHPGGAACFPPCAPQDPPGPTPAAATAPAVQAGHRQSRGGDGPWAGQCGCSSIPSPARPLSCSGTGWAGHASSTAARSSPLPAALPSAQAAPGGEADASAEPPPLGLPASSLAPLRHPWLCSSSPVGRDPPSTLQRGAGTSRAIPGT